MAEEPAAPPPGGSEFDTGAKGESYTRSQSVDAGAFKLYIGGRAIPGSQVLIGALVVVVLLVVVVSSIAGGGGGAAEAGAGDAGYSASFSAICNQAKAGWDLVGDYQFSGGTTPPGAILGGEAWVDDEYGVTVDGEGDFVSLGPNSAEGWAVDGDFTISFMFTNQACRIPGYYEMLFQALGQCGADDSGDGSSCSLSGGGNAGITIMMGCDNDSVDPSSTVDTSTGGHTLLRTVLADDGCATEEEDDGPDCTRAVFDVDLDLNRARGSATDGWVHLALAVTKTSVRTYIDGQPVEEWNIGYPIGSRWWRWATRPDNAALGDPAALRNGGFSGFTLQGAAYLGGTSSDRGWLASQGYAGSFAGVQLLRGAIQPADADCLFKTSGIHAGICPRYSTMFTGAGSGGNWGSGYSAGGGPDASGLAGREAGLAYAQRPHRLTTSDILSETSSRDLDGPSDVLSDQQATSGNAIEACAAICSAASSNSDITYTYMGLQYTNECFCGTSYGNRGERCNSWRAPDDCGRVEDSECDANGDGTPDCGMGIDGHCAWRNAVYDLSTGTPSYLGCYVDSEGEFSASLTLGGNTYWDDGYGLTFDGENDYAVITSAAAGSYPDSGSFSVAFFFTKSGCNIPGAFEALFVHRSITSPINNIDLRFADRDQPLTDVIEIFLGCSNQGEHSTVAGDIIRFIIADHVGTKATFDVPASDELSGGYVTDVWAQLVLSVSPNEINVIIDGIVTPASDFGFQPGTYSNDWAQTADNVAYPSIPALSRPLSTFSMSGGANGPIVGAAAAGGSSWFAKYFAGSISFVTLWMKALSQDESACLFSQQGQHIEVCRRPEDMWGTRWRNDLLGGVKPDDVVLGAQAYMDPYWGATLDGRGDFVAIAPMTDYTSDSTFSISFWFTRTQCTIPNSYEPLFSQLQRRGDSSYDGAMIRMDIGCQSSVCGTDQYGTCTTQVDGSPLEGAVLRVQLRDDNRKDARFDIPLSSEKTGGYVDDNWAHLVLSVTKTGVRSFVDGVEVAWPRYGFESRGSWRTDRDPQRNLAFPNPTQFQANKELGGFTMMRSGGRPYDGPGLNYLGCWTDSRDHDFTDAPKRFRSENSVLFCAQYCDDLGFRYAGMNFGDNCACSNHAPGQTGADGTPHPQAGDHECGMGCSGDASYLCGGWYRQSVYEITNVRAAASAMASGGCDFFREMGNFEGTGLTYMGCYDDDNENAFYTEQTFIGQDASMPDPCGGVACDGEGDGPCSCDPCPLCSPPTQTVGRGRSRPPSVLDGQPMTVELCASLCSSYSHFSLMQDDDNGFCRCGRTPPDIGMRVRDTECNDACQGDFNQWCGDGGGRAHSSVYRIDNAGAVPPNPCSGAVPPPAVFFGQRAAETSALSGGFAGSIAAVQLFRTPLDQNEADCLYRFSSSQVAVCQPVRSMYSVHYYQSFLPSPRDVGPYDSSDNGNADIPGFGTPEALAQCAAKCQQLNTQYAALNIRICMCGNSYGSAGPADESQCDQDGDGTVDCGIVPRPENAFSADAWSGEALPPACVARSTIYRVGRTIGRNYLPLAEPSYLGCFRDTNLRPAGVSLFGDAFFDDSGATQASDFTTTLITGQQDTSIGGGGDDFGIRFDGQDDWATVTGSDAGYATDGTFGVSFWATRPDCRVGGRHEWLFAHQKYPDTFFLFDRADNDPNAAVVIAYGCSENGEHSTACPDCGGPVHTFRTFLVDDEGNKAIFDVPLNTNAARGGYVVDQWVHFAIVVNGTSGVAAYVDGKRVSDSDIGFPPDYILSGARLRDDPDATPADRATWGNNVLTGMGTPEAERVCKTECGTRGYRSAALTYSNQCLCGDEDTRRLEDADPALCDGCGTTGRTTGQTTGREVSSAPVCNQVALVFASTSDASGVCKVAPSGGGVPLAQNAAAQPVLSAASFGSFSMDQVTNVPEGNGVSYVGCFRGGPETGWERMSIDGGLTVAKCATACDAASYPFLAVGRWSCQCGQSSPNPRTFPQGQEAECRSGCRGESTTVCGGPAPGPEDMYSVYSISNAAQVVGIPSPLNQPNPLYLAGKSWGSDPGAGGNFNGNIASLTLFRRAVGPQDVDCVFRETEKKLGSCRHAYNMPGISIGMPLRFDSGPPVDSSRYATLSVTNEAMYQPAGLQFLGGDPVSEYATVNTPNFASRRYFSISFWMTRSDCTAPGNLGKAPLISWGSDTTDSPRTQAKIQISQICQATDSTLAGVGAPADVVRVQLTDDDGGQFVADVALATELSGGLVSDVWSQFIVVVQRGSVTFYMDGVEIRGLESSPGTRGDACSDAQSADIGFPVGQSQSQSAPSFSADAVDSNRYLAMERCKRGCASECGAEFSGFSMDRSFYIGGGPESTGTVQYTGHISGLNTFRSTISRKDAGCLWKKAIYRTMP